MRLNLLPNIKFNRIKINSSENSDCISIEDELTHETLVLQYIKIRNLCDIQVTGNEIYFQLIDRTEDANLTSYICCFSIPRKVSYLL